MRRYLINKGRNRTKLKSQRVLRQPFKLKPLKILIKIKAEARAPQLTKTISMICQIKTIVRFKVRMTLKILLKIQFSQDKIKIEMIHKAKIVMKIQYKKRMKKMIKRKVALL